MYTSSKPIELGSKNLNFNIISFFRKMNIFWECDNQCEYFFGERVTTKQDYFVGVISIVICLLRVCFKINVHNGKYLLEVC